MKILPVDVTLNHLRRFVVTAQDTNVPPRGGAPVRVVITLLRDFQAKHDAFGILSRVLCCVACQVLVSSEQTWKKIIIDQVYTDQHDYTDQRNVCRLGIEKRRANERDNEGLRKNSISISLPGSFVFLTENSLHYRSFINYKRESA